jgi:hypothetical protein
MTKKTVTIELERIYEGVTLAGFADEDSIHLLHLDIEEYRELGSPENIKVAVKVV